MAYSLLFSDPSIEAGVKRVARSQIDKALEELAALRRDDAIHQVRKRCKKIRGLIRLVRPGFPDYKKENAAFRDAARLLSPARDRKAVLEAFDAICAHFDDPLARGAFTPIREQLEARREALDDEAIRVQMDNFRDALETARLRVDDWRIEGDPLDIVRDGVERTYGRAVNAFEAAKSERTGEAMHEWRKRVKYHRAHARLLKRSWPGLMERQVDEASALADELGDHHDLVVLLEKIDSGLITAEDEAGEAFVALLRKRQKTLEDRSFERGVVACSEKPKRLAERWTGYWKAAAKT